MMESTRSSPAPDSIRRAFETDRELLHWIPHRLCLSGGDAVWYEYLEPRGSIEDSQTGQRNESMSCSTLSSISLQLSAASPSTSYVPLQPPAPVYQPNGEENEPLRLSDSSSLTALPRYSSVADRSAAQQWLQSTSTMKVVQQLEMIRSKSSARVEAGRIVRTEHLDALLGAYPLGAIHHNHRMAWMRFACMTFYRRIMVIVLIINLAVFAAMMVRASRDPRSFTYASAATATGANLTAAVLVRHEHFVNLIFKLVCALPLTTPLELRRTAGKFAYNLGGIHSSCGISALIWYTSYCALVIQHFDRGAANDRALAAVAAFTTLLFLMMITLSHPWIRRTYHNTWELCHRFAGWAAVASIWTQTILLALSAAAATRQHLGLSLIQTPNFWFLLLITGSLIYPWLRVRRHSVTVQRLSSHATRLWFHSPHPMPSGRGVRLSRFPLSENHAFAMIPEPRHPGQEPYHSFLVSRAGDWTHDLIQHPPAHIWTRGHPTTGVVRIAGLFRSTLVVATGSGIGPCLSFLNVFPRHPKRVLWSAHTPAQTYGAAVMNSVFAADCNAVVIDTEETGHPDLVALSFALFQQMAAEAVVIISNPTVTREVVFGLEARGISAFGVVFDS